MLLSEGHIVYHGPREEVLPFFESLGFQLPERKGLADFLQEVTSPKDQKQYWSAPLCGLAVPLSSPRSGCCPCGTSLSAGAPVRASGQADSRLPADPRMALPSKLSSTLSLHRARNEKWRYMPVEAMAGSFQESGGGQRMAQAVEMPYDRDKSMPGALVTTSSEPQEEPCLPESVKSCSVCCREVVV